jgi:pimeloyl-ACP methyl ester carboxylesterase
MASDQAALLGERRTIAVDGCAYVSWAGGSGPLVLLLHGWPVTSQRWWPLAARLQGAGYRTLAVDLRGMGQSACSMGPFDKELLARQMFVVVQALEPAADSFDIIGHDWGGSIGIAMAHLEPVRVAHLIVEDEIPPGIPAVIPEPGASAYSHWHGEFHRQVGFAETLVQGKEVEYINYFLNLRADRSTLDDATRQAYLAAAADPFRLQLAFGYYRTAPADRLFFQRLLNNPLSMRCFAIAGRYGMGQGVLDMLRTIAVHADGRMLERSGHYPAEEEPEAFNAAVLEYLRRP